jgi:chemotaxis protein methyltransferase CheR
MELSDAQFQSFSRMVYDISGIDLREGKKSLVVARLAKRIRQGGFDSFEHYWKHVVNDKSGDEVVNLLDCISTNLTYFFRESKHFDFLAAKVLPEMAGRRAGELSLWCAGCSTGEEPYSLAITILERLREASPRVKIYATDISTSALKTAAQGVYNAARVADIPGPIVRRYFQKGQNSWEGHFRLKGRVREMVEFFRLNLMEPFPFDDYLHVIFCRNVMIYFDRNTQAGLVERFYHHLARRGYLFVGHSESLTGIRHGFKYVMPSVYRK